MTTRLQTLDRGIQALEIVASRTEISVADLAAELDVARAICYRIVTTLEAHGMVSRGPDRLVRLGGGVARLASRYWPSLLRRSELVLQELADITGVTGHMSVVEGDEGVVVLTVRPRRTDLKVAFQVGFRFPLTAGAPGWAIRALRPAQPDDDAQVRQARIDGYSASAGHLHEGMQGVAVGIPRAPHGYTPEACIGLATVTGVDLTPAIPLVIAAAHAVGSHVEAHVATGTPDGAPLLEPLPDGPVDLSRVLPPK